MSGTDRWLTAQTDRGLSELGAATDFTLGKTVPPVPIGNTSIIQYTFGPGNLGIALEEAQGGKRVVISEVTEGSQASRMGIPLNGVLMKVGSRTATGQRRAAVGKWLATAERPLVLQIMHPGGAAAAQSSLTAVNNTADDPFAVQYQAPQTKSYTHPAANLGPVSSHMFDTSNLGLKDLQEVNEGVIIAGIQSGSAAAAQGVETGSIIIAVNGDEARMQKGACSEQMRKASRPLTLTVVLAPERIVQSIQRRDLADDQSVASNGPAPYTFDAGPLGLTLEEQSGDRGGVMVSHVSGAAEALGVPVGGVLVRINTEGVGNYTKAHVSKVIAKAARPITLYIRLGAPKADIAAAPADDAAAAAAPAVETASETGKSRSSNARGGAAAAAAAKAAEEEAKKGAKAAKDAKKSAKATPDAKAAKTGRGGEEKAGASNKRGSRTIRTVAMKFDKPVDAWGGSATQREEGPPTLKFTFGPGSLGLGLTDVPGGKGGVTVSEVAAGSTAAELGVEPGGMILALNGSDVTGHGKISLGKMIGYLPRPLVMTMSVPEKKKEEAAADARDDDAARAKKAKEAKEGDAKAAKAAKAKARKSTRAKEIVAVSLDDEKALPAPKPAAKPLGGEAAAEGAERDAAAADAAIQDGAEGAKPAPKDFENEADDDDDDGDDDELDEAADAADEDEEGAASAQEDEDSQAPTGSLNDSSNARADAPPTIGAQEPKVPWRAHPPPQAPKEAFPTWASRPPLRAPRVVVGADAKYVLKPTAEAFQHASLTQKSDEPGGGDRHSQRRQSMHPGMAMPPAFLQQPATERGGA